jgi:predicted hotdog family 3-hydroxylacyl-ACP dehydratase
MILIDDVIARQSNGIVTAVTIRSTGLFFQPGRGMPSHVALEWMAQTCAAFAGSEALDNGEAVRIGFLLGTRDFCASQSWFANGARLYIRVQLEYRDDEMANFACEVAEATDGPAIVKANLSVFQPHDAAALINETASTK